MTYQPYNTYGQDRPSRWLVTCDHAANTVPDEINGGSLGLPDADMQRHIAYDVGAAGVTKALAQALDAPAVLSNFSRLVIDPNRGLDDPTLLMRLYDGSVIPANRDADDLEKSRRIEAYYAPYDAALGQMAARQPDTVIAAIHSFTPQLRARLPRPWHIGILYDQRDSRLAHPLLRLLREQSDLVVGENEPYAGHLPGDAIDRHALRMGRANVLIELRSDLIAEPATQAAWGLRLAPILEQALTEANI